MSLITTITLDNSEPFEKITITSKTMVEMTGVSGSTVDTETENGTIVQQDSSDTVFESSIPNSGFRLSSGVGPVTIKITSLIHQEAGL